MKTLTQLLTLKQFREGEAEREVVRSVNELERCEQVRHEREQALNEFRVYAREKELAMYADLCTRTVELGEIEDVQYAVSRLREEETQHAEAVSKACADEAAARAALEQARHVHHEAIRMTQKFTELLEESQQQRTRELVQREDDELDESAAVGHARNRTQRASLTENQ